MTTTTANNRALTLAGANKIFEAVTLEIHHHDLNYYYTEYQGHRWERPTLTDLCRALVRHHFQPQSYPVPAQLWATPTVPAPADAAIACTAHAIAEVGAIPGAEDDLVHANTYLNLALEYLQSWQARGN